MNTYTNEQLDHELARRERWPPASVRQIPHRVREEWTTVAALQAELDATPLAHEDREWREWELALARRLAETKPGAPFYRVVTVPVA